jgi:hypothetical protein
MLRSFVRCSQSFSQNVLDVVPTAYVRRAYLLHTKVKGEVHPRIGHEGICHTLATFNPGKETWYPLHRRVHWLQGWSGWVQKVSAVPGFNPQTISPVVSSYIYYTVYMCPILSQISRRSITEITILLTVTMFPIVSSNKLTHIDNTYSWDADNCSIDESQCLYPIVFYIFIYSICVLRNLYILWMVNMQHL